MNAKRRRTSRLPVWERLESAISLVRHGVCFILRRSGMVSAAGLDSPICLLSGETVGAWFRASAGCGADARDQPLFLDAPGGGMVALRMDAGMEFNEGRFARGGRQSFSAVARFVRGWPKQRQRSRGS